LVSEALASESDVALLSPSAETISLLSHPMSSNKANGNAMLPRSVTVSKRFSVLVPMLEFLHDCGERSEMSRVQICRDLTSVKVSRLPQRTALI
jgi:hypothetical protein